MQEYTIPVQSRKGRHLLGVMQQQQSHQILEHPLNALLVHNSRLTFNLTGIKTNQELNKMFQNVRGNCY